MRSRRPRDLEKRILDYILTEVTVGADPSEISDLTPLVTGGLLDSIATMRLVGFLEGEFSVSINAEDVSIENLDNVVSIAALVLRKTDAASKDVRCD